MIESPLRKYYPARISRLFGDKSGFWTDYYRFVTRAYAIAERLSLHAGEVEMAHFFRFVVRKEILMLRNWGEKRWGWGRRDAPGGHGDNSIFVFDALRGCTWIRSPFEHKEWISPYRALRAMSDALLEADENYLRSFKNAIKRGEL